MKQSFKRLIGIWIGVMVVAQIGATLLLEIGVIIPIFIESLLVIIQIIPLIILSYLVAKDQDIKKTYRILAGAFLIIAMLACILPFFFST